MEIAVLSDTHGDLADIKLFLEKVKGVDAIIHLGDYVSDGEYIRKYYNGRFIGVKGNCDFGGKDSEEVITNICGKKFFITHGHRYNVKFSLLNIKYKAMSEEIDVVLFGHTHKVFHDIIDNTLFINPGSLGDPRYTNKKTYCMLTIEKCEITYKIKEI